MQSKTQKNTTENQRLRWCILTNEALRGMIAESRCDIDGVVRAALQIRCHIGEYHAAHGIAGSVHQTLDMVADDGFLSIIYQILQILGLLKPVIVLIGKDGKTEIHRLEG